jgi:hypothetical protein
VPANDFDSSFDGFRFGSIFAYETETAQSITIQTHILGIRLSEETVSPSFGPSTEGIGIIVEVRSSKSLIGHIKEGEKLFFNHYFDDFVPLFEGWIASSWIVSTWLDKHHGACFCIAEVFTHRFEINTNIFLIIVSILGIWDTEFSSHPSMRTPGRI